MRVMVAGGGGFLAKHLVRKLVDAGHTVRAAELPGRDLRDLEALGVEVVFGDLCEAAHAARACEGVEVVFNCAALLAPVGKWSAFWAVNVELVDNLMAGCRAAGVRRFVHVSSPSAVFDGTNHIDADESLPYPKTFLNHYCATKAESEKRVLAANGPTLETVALRPHAIWGPGDRTLFPRIIERARANRMAQVGDGTNVISTLYVENGADALVLAATASAAPGRVYFLTDGVSVNLWTFLRRVIGDLGLPPITKRVPYRVAYAAGAVLERAWTQLELRGEPPITRYSAAELATHHSYSIERARADLGYEPAVTHDEGLSRFYPWAREHLL